jgi:hypothetical protein
MSPPSQAAMVSRPDANASRSIGMTTQGQRRVQEANVTTGGVATYACHPPTARAGFASGSARSRRPWSGAVRRRLPLYPFSRGRHHAQERAATGHAGHVHWTVHLTRYAAIRPRGSNPGLRGCWGLESVRGRHLNPTIDPGLATGLDRPSIAGSATTGPGRYEAPSCPRVVSSKRWR